MVALQRQLDFVLVEQHLDDDVRVVGTAAIEHKLQVACHRDDLVVGPALAVERFKVGGGQSETVLSLRVWRCNDFQQAHQWQQHGVVTIAQLGAGLFQLDADVGIVDDFAQQGSLAVGLTAAACGTETVVDIPPRVALPPVVVQLVVGKQVVQCHPQAEVGVLQAVGQFVEAVAELVGIDVLPDVGRIVEQRLHQAAAGVVTLAEGGEQCLCGRILPQRLQTGVGTAQVVHVALGGVVVDEYLRTHARELHHGILHRQEYAERRRAAGIDVCPLGKDLREAVDHASHDLLVLQGTQTRQLAITAASVLADDVQPLHHVLAQGSQLAQTVGLGHHGVGSLVVVGPDEIARAVASVVADIEGVLTLGSRRQLQLRRFRVSQIVAGRATDVVANFLAYTLCLESHGHDRQDGTKQDFSHKFFQFVCKIKK